MSSKIRPMIFRTAALVLSTGALTACVAKKDPWNDFMDFQPAPTALPGSEETKPIDMATVPFDQKLDRARSSQAAKNIDRAREYFNAAVEEGKGFGPADTRYHSALESAAFFNYQNGNAKLALENFETLRSVLETTFGPESPQVASVSQHLGNVYRFTGDYAKAEEAFKKSISIRERGGPNPELGRTLHDYADMLDHNQRSEEAAKIEAQSKAMLAIPAPQAQK